MSEHSDERAPARQDPSVLIVGAGPTGLTLACELARLDIPFRLIEAAAGPQPGSRGKGLQPRSIEILDDLGVADRIISGGRFAMPIRMTLPDGRVRDGGAEPAELRNRPDIPYTTSLVTPQWRVENVLRDRLAELGGAVEFGTRLLDVQQDDQGVTASVTTGSEPESVSATWLVGCDGGRGVVRRLAGIGFPGETLEDVRMLVADVHVPGLEDDLWQMWQGPEGFVSLCPLPSTDLFQYQASIASGQNPDTALTNLQALFEHRTGRSDIHLEDPAWVSLWRANIRLADHYRHGRLLIAGDAAHVHSPAGGQGMNTGIQDAHNLGWKLAAVVAGADATLLDTYEAERRPVAEHVLGLSNARLRQTVDGRGMPIRRDASTLQLDIGYRGSSLARDDRDDRDDREDEDGLRAGDRAPDATGILTRDGEHCLFDLTRGGRFTLLAFGPTARTNGIEHDVVRALRVLDATDGQDGIIDRDRLLTTEYGVENGALVLIRPDGYIGVISDAGDPTVVADYLRPLIGSTR